MVSGGFVSSMRLTIGLFGFFLSTVPVLAETAFDNCMRTHAPPPGPTYGFMAAQASCQAVIRSRSTKQRNAAICVAKSTKTVRSAKQFNFLVERCYGGLQVHSQIKFVQCLLPNYMSANSQEKMSRLVKGCQN